MLKYFSDYDFSDFWDNSDYAVENYISEPVTDELIGIIEKELKYKLPEAYIELMKIQNGGIPLKYCYPTKVPTSWAENHIAISGILGIGKKNNYSLCGGLGSQFMIDEWGYPNIGVYICDCPSAGHDMVALDYRKCDPEGEPEVVHIDQEYNYKITSIAPNFETFIRG